MDYYGAQIPDTLNAYVGISWQKVETEAQLNFPDGLTEFFRESSIRADFDVGSGRNERLEYGEIRIISGAGIGTLHRYSTYPDTTEIKSHYILDANLGFVIRLGFSKGLLHTSIGGAFLYTAFSWISKSFWDLLGQVKIEKQLIYPDLGLQLMVGLGKPERITVGGGLYLSRGLEGWLRVAPFKEVPLQMVGKISPRGNNNYAIAIGVAYGIGGFFNRPFAPDSL